MNNEEKTTEQLLEIERERNRIKRAQLAYLDAIYRNQVAAYRRANRSYYQKFEDFLFD